MTGGVKRSGLSCAEADVLLEELIAAAGGLDVIRASRESRTQFFEACALRILPMTDGRARAHVGERLLLTIHPNAFADRDRLRRADRQKRRALARAKRAKPKRRALRSSRPRCGTCGASGRLLDAAGACVNRTRCGKSGGSARRHQQLSAPDAVTQILP